MSVKQPFISDKGYLGNNRLKNTGVAIEWTPELVAEYIKCSQDPIYFVKKYMRIVNAEGEEVPFDLYDYQEKIIKSVIDNRFTIVACARQSGKSQTTCGFVLWYAIFNDNKNIGILANKGETARKLLKRIQFSYELLPRWLQQGVKEWNKGSVEFENGSRIFATATSKSSIRGDTIQLLMVDEAAFIENWDEFYTSTFNTISNSKTAKVVLISTPNGMNHFYPYWDNAIKGKNNYHPIKVTWRDVPGRDEAWREEHLAGMNYDKEKFAQEQEVEFIGSSGTLIAGWKLQQLKDSYETPIATGENSKLYQYEKPQKNHIYVTVCDVSRGKGLDYSAFSVFDVTAMPYRQVCAFKDNLITPLDYSEVIFRTSKSYNNAMVLVEINDLGQQVVDNLFDQFSYENILYTESAGRAGKKITSGFGSKNIDRGVRTTKTVKAVGCAIIKLLIEQDKLIIPDYNTIQELFTFTRKNDVTMIYAAEEGKHDDLVMSLVLFGWLADTDYFKEMTDINTLKELREMNEEQMKNELLSFGFYDGHDDDEPEVIDSLAPKHWMF